MGLNCECEITCNEYQVLAWVIDDTGSRSEISQIVEQRERKHGGTKDGSYGFCSDTAQSLPLLSNPSKQVVFLCSEFITLPLEGSC